MSSNAAVVPSAVVVDADNTLWDTNAVFQDARRQMISVLVDEQTGNGSRALDRGYRDVLRRLADRLSLITGQNDLALLARGMAAFLSGDGSNGESERIERAARRAEARKRLDGITEARIEAAAEAFRAALRTAPPLLDGAEELLQTIEGWRSARPAHRQSVLFSEGDPDRLQFAFEAYGIGTGRRFDDLVLREKTHGAFEAVGRSIKDALGSPSDQPPIVTIGDSLKRDIQPANALGWTTIYCPGDFKGHETPETESEVPDYTVSSLHDVLDLLRL